MIYVPSDNTYKFCPSIYNSNTLRVYDRQPNINSYANYRDYYFNSHYVYNEGQQTWGNYGNTPNCLSSDVTSSNVFYRNDITEILITTLILLLICFYFPYKIISRMFGRWLKL